MNLFERAYELAHQLFPAGGTCLEFGVYVGTTYCWQAEQMLGRHQQSRLVGFDSWQGLPPETERVQAPERHAPGEFASPKDVVLEKLAALTGGRDEPRFRLVDGFYSESLTDAVRATLSDLIFVNIDVDIHRSTLELLDFVHPLLRPGVVLYWDDWRDPKDHLAGEWGEHLAWAEWSAAHPDVAVETIEVNPFEQRIMVVTAAGGTSAEEAGFNPLSARRLCAWLASPERDPHYQRYLRLKRLLDRLRGRGRS
jgi:hypothetical protein